MHWTIALSPSKHIVTTHLIPYGNETGCCMCKRTRSNVSAMLRQGRTDWACILQLQLSMLATAHWLKPTVCTHVCIAALPQVLCCFQTDCVGHVQLLSGCLAGTNRVQCTVTAVRQSMTRNNHLFSVSEEGCCASASVRSCSAKKLMCGFNPC